MTDLLRELEEHDCNTYNYQPLSHEWFLAREKAVGIALSLQQQGHRHFLVDKYVKLSLTSYK